MKKKQAPSAKKALEKYVDERGLDLHISDKGVRVYSILRPGIPRLDVRGKDHKEVLEKLVGN